MQLYEQYRPRLWSEVVGQDKIVRRIQGMSARGLAGRAYWIVGASGTGKTTIARLLAGEVAEDLFVEEVDASACTPAYLRKLEISMNMRGWGKGGRAYLINEAHGLSKATVRQLLVLLERLPDHVLVAFTTTCENQEQYFEGMNDAAPLLSRCIRLDLARRGLADAFAEKCREIASQEGINGKPIESYRRLARKHRNNMRAMLQAVESGVMLDTKEGV